jgi:hypothetical protein
MLGCVSCWNWRKEVLTEPDNHFVILNEKRWAAIQRGARSAVTNFRHLHTPSHRDPSDDRAAYCVFSGFPGRDCGTRRFIPTTSGEGRYPVSKTPTLNQVGVTAKKDVPCRHGFLGEQPSACTPECDARLKKPNSSPGERMGITDA